MSFPATNRLRHNYDTALWAGQGYTYHFTSYAPNGSFDYTFTINSSPKIPFSATYIRDVRKTKANRRKVGQDKGAGAFPVSPVFHSVMDYSKVGLVSDFTVDGYSNRFDVDGRPRLPLPYYVMEQMCGSVDEHANSFGLRIPNSFRNTYSEQAFNYYSEVFPEEFSLAEFVQGFAKLSELLPEIQHSITKTISGGFLNYKFGWENLMRDLGFLGSLFDEVIKRMEWFKTTYGRPTRLGFKRAVPWQPDFGDHVYTSNQAFGLLGTRASLSAYKATYRATAWIYQTLSHVDGLEGFLRVFLGMMGLNNPVKAFWNTLPMSFVVDWFFNVSQHLDHLTRAQPPVGWDVNDVTHSVRYDITWTLDQMENYSSHQAVVSYPVGMRVYERYVGLDYDLELLNPETLSSNQQLLLFAMLHQLS